MATDCIFCKIANGEFDTEFVYENDKVVAFNDIEPLAPVHVLIVPKAHVENILDGVDSDTLAAVVDAVEHVVEAKGIKESGFRVLTNTGDDGGQSVHHLHFHVLGGAKIGNPSVELY